ncbi:hypothetical protein [Streptococcus mutans]|uniref:hypothetical protein n=1 Tax=Streptococcus mutans TaxID=1309 RepID=UPI000B544BAA|nr:hypothetical protein [Streptococcus mutans]
MGLIYGRSYPPKRIEDNRSQFEKEKYQDWNYIQVVRQMLISGNPSVTKEHLDNLEAHFKQRYGESADDFGGGIDD